MELCSLILSFAIVGATETRPGIMRVEYLENETVEEIYVYKEDYINCWEYPVLPESGPTDTGRTSTATYP
jgi:hypothetical protein